jgi:hypothetical protein
MHFLKILPLKMDLIMDYQNKKDDLLSIFSIPVVSTPFLSLFFNLVHLIACRFHCFTFLDGLFWPTCINTIFCPFYHWWIFWMENKKMYVIKKAFLLLSQFSLSSDSCTL